jgi:hypothetical protein
MTTDERPSWAVRLETERLRRGWNKHQVARRLHEAAGLPPGPVTSLARQIRRYELGENFPRDWAAAYAGVFEMSEVELFGTAAIAQRLDAFPSTFTPPDRYAPPDPLALSHQGAVAPELVGYFLHQLPGHYAADAFLGPHHLIPPVLAQAQLIGQLVAAAEDGVRRELLRVGVAYAELLGWLHQDAGHVRESAHWRDVALAMAHRSGDRQVVSYALSNKAMHAADMHDGPAVVDFAQAALDDPGRLSPKVRVIALQHQAHGWSMAPDRSAVDRLLDEADPLVDQVDDPYLWGNACKRTPAYIEVQRATCYGRMGLPSEAANLWGQILGDTPDEVRRDSAVFRTRHAAALAALGEADRVVAMAGELVEALNQTGSARLRRELLVLPDNASGWASSGPGRELAEIIASIPDTGGVHAGP